MPTTMMQKENMALRKLAVDAAIWATPIVSVDAMRQAFFDLGCKTGDFAYLEGYADAGFQVTTPNASTHYVYFDISLKHGPLVLEVPAAEGAGLFGSLSDAWQVPLVDVGPAGADAGKGAQYLLVPPGWSGDIAPQYMPVRFQTMHGYALLRAIEEGADADAAARAVDLIQKLKAYPLAEAAKPRPSRRVDLTGELFDGIMRFDETYFESLARMLADEPALPRDAEMLKRLSALGIARGVDFRPDPDTKALLRNAAKEAHKWLLDRAPRDGVLYWSDRQWRVPGPAGAASGFSFEHNGKLDVENRGVFFFMACAPPKTLGQATFYLVSHTDASGARLTGDARYRLRVPATPPARQFWAVTLYDSETCAFIQDASKVELNSYRELRQNPDGSFDLFLGGDPPAGDESNWIPTEPERRFFVAFRLYGPSDGIYDKTWKLSDIEKLAPAS